MTVAQKLLKNRQIQCESTLREAQARRKQFIQVSR